MKKSLVLFLCLGVSFGLRAYSWKVINNTGMPLKVNADTSLAGAHHKSRKFSGEHGESHHYKWGGIHGGACFKQLKIYNKKGKKIATIKRTRIQESPTRSRSAEWSGCSNANLFLNKRGNKIVASIKGGTRY